MTPTIAERPMPDSEKLPHLNIAPPIPEVSVMEMIIIFLVWLRSILFLIRLFTPTLAIVPNKSNMEHEIDVINAQLPLLKSFILPGGCRAAAIAHICRTVCRRAERRIYSLRDEQHPVDQELLEYMNRLSDYFFVLSRKVNLENKTSEILWDNSCI